MYVCMYICLKIKTLLVLCNIKEKELVKKRNKKQFHEWDSHTLMLGTQGWSLIGLIA